MRKMMMNRTPRKRGTRNALLSAVIGTALLAAHAASAQAWEVVDMDASVELTDLFMLDDGLHGWAVGSSAASVVVVPVVLRTTDGGQSWESDIFPYSVTPNAVCFVNPSQGWVACGGGKIYVTTDGGDDWTQQNSGVWRTLTAITFVSETEGWITGGYNDGSSYLVLHTTDAGANWVDQSFGSGCYDCSDVSFADSMHGWICGRDSGLRGHIHHTSDGGATWVRQNIPYADGTVSSVAFVDSNVGWAGTSSIYLNPAGATLHTIDGGTTWTIDGYTGLHYNYAIDARDSQHVPAGRLWACARRPARPVAWCAPTWCARR
jgi:photosystem II stability/assembly factor-like uncharacterized protein